jgi:ubiquinone/menaquinone biosynthesis C-methylase UbiE
VECGPVRCHYCCSRGTGVSPRGTKSVRDHRYSVYAPWVLEAMRFKRFRWKDVLEVGVGLGSDHLSLASCGARMTALDLSREHRGHTVKHLSYWGYSTRPIHGDAEQMPFANASSELVYSFGVLHHTPDTDVAVSEVHREFRPAGWRSLVFTTGTLHSSGFG